MGLLIDGTTGINNATWATTGRPGSPVAGQMGYNNTYGGLEVYNGATSAWNAVSGGPAFAAGGAAYQTFSDSISTKIIFSNKLFDTNNNYDATTNYRFTPSVAGYYSISAICRLALPSANATVNCTIYKNGSGIGNPQTSYVTASGASGVPGGSSTNAVASVLVFLNGTTDYVEAYGAQTSGAPQTSCGAPNTTFQFTGFFVRGA